MAAAMRPITQGTAWESANPYERGYEVEVGGWRTQWAVGQGSFHTGAVHARSRSVHYVYDCGSQPRYRSDLTREIDAALDRLHDRVDVLYISHFHADHVSGVERLLNRACISRVVLPLTPAVHRVMALAAALGSDEPGPLAPWYVDLVADPRGYFESRGTEVTEVLPNAEGDVMPTEFPIDLETDFDVAFRPPNPGQQLSRAASAVLADQVMPLWLWIPWAASRADAAQGAFLSELGAALGKDPHQLLAALEDPSELRRIGTDRGNEIRRAYNAAAGDRDLNFTTMSLYSGPPPAAQAHGCAVGTFESGRPHAAIWREEVGWLGSGDAELGTAQDATEFNRAFAAIRPDVGTFVLPHHGSDHNSHQGLISAFEAGTTFVASADTYGRWEHPGRRVTREALRHGQLAWVRCDPSTRWTEEFAADLPRP